jgi:hypothetical protein
MRSPLPDIPEMKNAHGKAERAEDKESDGKEK